MQVVSYQEERWRNAPACPLYHVIRSVFLIKLILRYQTELLLAEC